MPDVSIYDPKQGQNFKVLEGQYIFTTLHMNMNFLLWQSCGEAYLTISAAVANLLLTYE